MLSHLKLLHGSTASVLALKFIRQLHVQIPRVAHIGHALERACNHSMKISGFSHLTNMSRPASC